MFVLYNGYRESKTDNYYFLYLFIFGEMPVISHKYQLLRQRVYTVQPSWYGITNGPGERLRSNSFRCRIVECQWHDIYPPYRGIEYEFAAFVRCILGPDFGSGIKPKLYKYYAEREMYVYFDIPPHQKEQEQQNGNVT